MKTALDWKIFILDFSTFVDIFVVESNFFVISSTQSNYKFGCSPDEQILSSPAMPQNEPTESKLQ